MLKKLMVLGLLASFAVFGIITYGCGRVDTSGGISFGGIGVGGDPNSGTVSGTVIDFYTGAPISGATVTDGTVSTTTDSNGEYTLAGVSSGTIMVSATATGYSVMSLKANNDQMNFALFSSREAMSTGILNIAVVDSTGEAVVGMTTVSNGVSGDVAGGGSGGIYVADESPVGKIIVAQESRGTMSAYVISTLATGETKTVTLTYPTESQLGTITGTVTNPWGVDITGDLCGAHYLSFRQANLFAMMFMYPSWMAYGKISASNQFTARRQATTADVEYQIYVLAGTNEVGESRYSYSIALARTTLEAGGNVSLAMELPDFLTATSPADGTAGTGATPTLSWTNPWSASSVGYFVFLIPASTGSASPETSWLGITADTSIQVPALADLQTGQEYYWVVISAKIPDTVLADTDLTNLADLTSAGFSTTLMYSKFTP
ncbi:carboxypeptidase-like regulatory domain-containing protein [Candidatus Margulisiibacteriota bacterium]